MALLIAFWFGQLDQATHTYPEGKEEAAEDGDGKFEHLDATELASYWQQDASTSIFRGMRATGSHLQPEENQEDEKDASEAKLGQTWPSLLGHIWPLAVWDCAPACSRLKLPHWRQDLRPGAEAEAPKVGIEPVGSAQS